MSSIFPKTSGNPSGISASDLVGAFSLVGLVVFSWFLSGAESAFVSALAIVAYGILFYAARILYGYVFRKDFPRFLDFFRTYVRRIGAIVFAVGFSIGAFAAYQNEIDPAKLPEYVISNGEKTVRFRAMAHIGSQGFYDAVKTDIAQARSEGYVLFYE